MLHARAALSKADMVVVNGVSNLSVTCRCVVTVQLVNLRSLVQVYVMTNKWQFKAVQRMDLGAGSDHGISLSSQKSRADGVNGTAVTASGASKDCVAFDTCCLSMRCPSLLPCMLATVHVFCVLQHPSR